jgi:hypothetical protein
MDRQAGEMLGTALEQQRLKFKIAAKPHLESALL